MMEMQVDGSSPLDSCSLKDFGDNTSADGLATLAKREPKLISQRKLSYQKHTLELTVNRPRLQHRGVMSRPSRRCHPA